MTSAVTSTQAPARETIAGLSSTQQAAEPQQSSAPGTGDSISKSSEPNSDIDELKQQLELLKQLKSEREKAKQQPVDELQAMKDELARLKRQVEMKKMRDEINALKSELGIVPEPQPAKNSSLDVNTIMNNASGIAGLILAGLKEKGKIDENGKVAGGDATTDKVIELLNMVATQGQTSGENQGNLVNTVAGAIIDKVV